MNFDLRKAVMANLDDSNYDEIRETIIDAIESGEEKTLPGLGVIFEFFGMEVTILKKKRLSHVSLSA